MNETPKERPADKLTDDHVTYLIRKFVNSERWSWLGAGVRKFGGWILAAIAALALLKENIISLFGKGG